MSATAPPALWGMPTRQWMGWALAASGAATVLALAGCGASQPRTRWAVLEVTGIGNVGFGRPSGRVAQRLNRMLGRPGSASGVFRGRGPRACGFDHEIVWSSLATTPTVGLTVYLKRGRFVGYAYGPRTADVALSQFAKVRFWLPPLASASATRFAAAINSMVPRLSRPLSRREPLPCHRFRGFLRGRHEPRRDVCTASSTKPAVRDRVSVP
jgi:hypothetical protein